MITIGYSDNKKTRKQQSGGVRLSRDRGYVLGFELGLRWSLEWMMYDGRWRMDDEQGYESAALSRSLQVTSNGC